MAVLTVKACDTYWFDPSRFIRDTPGFMIFKFFVPMCQKLFLGRLMTTFSPVKK